MKRILAILVAATMVLFIFAMTTIANAATADTVFESVEGTATIDGTMDDGYSSALHLVLDQCGTNNGGGATLDSPAADVYIMNDAEWVYVFYDVHDSSLDNTSANYYEQDSVELFYMADNSKNQWRIHYDEGNADPDQTKVPEDQYAVATTDGGYAVEAKFPITDVKDNCVETCVQVNAATAGKRDATVYVTGHPEGDDAYQRDNRQTTYDVWWTLKLAGTFEDNRVDPVEEPVELTVKNYAALRDAQVFVQLYTQDKVSWGWHGVGTGEAMSVGGSVTPEGFKGMFAPVYAYTAEETADFTSLPIFALQIGDNGYLEPSIKNDDGSYKDAGTMGDTGRYKFTYSDITVKANGYNDVVVPGGEIVAKWTAKSEGSYTSGTASTVDLITPAREQLGLDVEGACTWLAAVTDVDVTVTFDQIELLTLDDINAFEATLGEIEQAFVDESLAEYTTRVNDALAAAQAANGDVAAIQSALDDATKAVNRATKEVENAGYAADGTAGTYVTGTLAPIVEQIQGILDEANAAAAPVEEEAPVDEAEAEAPAEDTADTSSEGGSTGIIIAIVVIVVVVIAAVVGIVLGKKKKA